jgi:hypothetical protein|nr:MAG TPA: hypothetical protein [Caudoviricetes sp.]DAR39201.1 MAG TPA: hypothetical protein [Caudoviricetes sp.]DAR78893.1 MAG TPA: hypothetical protein [Caudoviricetes sp.]DAS37808.1 MAG TPA: hypothetical protein [Caudoviricetes sp.]DAS48141.1 MAG TPA: hypothetical protein [Caudoviricetes sp.]
MITHTPISFFYSIPLVNLFDEIKPIIDGIKEYRDGK